MKKETINLLIAMLIVIGIGIIGSIYTGQVTKTSINLTCIDSDNGYNLYEKGTCKYNKRSFTDYCSSEKIAERYCSKQGCTFNITSCPIDYTCKNGACISTLDVCQDSDNGFNIYEKGYCRDSTGTKTDRCGQEWMCSAAGSPYCVSKLYKCPEGTSCTQDAVCVPISK